MHIGFPGRTPDLPVGVLAVPDELLDDDVLDAVLYLGGGDDLVGGVSANSGLGHGLSGSQADDDLADTGVWHVGDFDGAVCHDACAAELVADQIPGHLFVGGAALDLAGEFLGELLAADASEFIGVSPGWSY